MTERECFLGMGRAMLGSDFARWEGVRFARIFAERHGDAILDSCEGFLERGEDGQIRAVEDPGEEFGLYDPMGLLGAEAAGFFAAVKLLERGRAPEVVLRRVRRWVAKVSAAWPGSPFDKATRRRAYRVGVRRALREAGHG